MLWLYVHFPRLALEAAFVGDQRPLPQLLLKPGVQSVLQCNEVAHNLGVRLGMNKKTAFCLLSDCAIADYDPLKEQEALQQLALHCYRHAAEIALQKPDGLLLEVGSMLQSYHGLDTYWQRLREQLQQTGFSMTMSTGHTPAVARVLAQAAIELCSQNHDTLRQALMQLSVTQLGLAVKTTHQLSSMGIHTYQQLLSLPRRELGFRFGMDTVQQLNALESDNQPPSKFILPARFKQRIDLTYEAEHAKGLLFPLKRCLQNLESYLLSRQLKCEKLLIKLEHRDGRASLMSIPSVRGSYRQSDWLALLQVYFERAKLIDPVVALILRAKDFLPLSGEADDFIGDRFAEADADQMQSLLIARLGAQQVNKLGISHDPRPEIASQLIDSRHSQFNLNPKNWPTLLLPQAKAIQIHRYEILSGPERIEAGWYDGQSSRRDYYVAQTKTGAMHWLFRRDDGQWFLHGEFA